MARVMLKEASAPSLLAGRIRSRMPPVPEHLPQTPEVLLTLLLYTVLSPKGRVPTSSLGKYLTPG